MFFFISKIVSFLFNPVFWVFVLLLVAIFSRVTTRKRKSLIWAVSLFYFFSNSFILEEFTRAWEVPATKYENLDTYDAGIVLGGILGYDYDFKRIQFYKGADRLFQAIELYKMGFIKKIFFVGGSGSVEFSQMKEGVLVKRYLLTIGIPEADIWIENESRNTMENAQNSKVILEKNGLIQGKILLITSAMHMRRALACYKVVGIEATPYCVDRHASPVRRFTPDHLLIPNVHVLLNWEALLHEWVGLAVYKIKGYA